MDDARLRDMLERALAEGGAAAVKVTGVERLPFEQATSYPLDLLRLRLDSRDLDSRDGLDVVVKEFGTSRLPKADPTARGERELAVYRTLLDDPRLGTAQLHGFTWRPVRLLLEYVCGTPLYDHGLESWVEAAAWLGAFQARMALRADDVLRCRSLVRHDASFFGDHALAARDAAAAFGSRAARRVGALVDGYDGLVEAMVSQPRTLVHGSFRPQNIVVSDAGDGAVRICPVDWELAAEGSLLYDVAFLADGFDGPDLERLLTAYRRARGATGDVAVHEEGFLLDCFRLHKVLKSIGDAVQLRFAPCTVDKLLGIGEGLRERLG